MSTKSKTDSLRIFSWRVFLAGWICFNCSTVKAVDTLFIVQHFKNAELQDFGWLYFDKNHELNFEKVKNLPSESFKPLKETGITFAPSKQVYWIKFHVKNQTDTLQNLILEIENPRINRLQVFTKKTNDTFIKSKIHGDDFPFQTRVIKHRHYLFPFEIKPQEAQTVYVFADKYAENITLSANISDADFFYQKDQKTLFFYALYLGFLVFVCVLITIFSLLLRQTILFYFWIYSVSITLNLVAWLGFGFQFIWGDFPYFNDICGNFFTIISSLSLLGLTQHYLQTKTHFPFLNKLIGYIQTGLFGFLIYLFFYKSFSGSFGFIIVRFSLVFQTAYVLLMIIAPVLSYRKFRKTDHLIFLSGFLFVLTGTVAHLAENMEWIDYNFLTKYGILLGFGFDLLILMYIIGKQIQEAFVKNIYLSNQINQIKLEAANALFEGQQQERQRLSLDLHDGASLRLATLKMRLSQLLPKLTSENQKIEAQNLLDEIGKITELIRSFSHALSPLDLKEQTLVDAIEDLIYTIEQANSDLIFECEFSEFEGEKLTNIQAHVLFQITQELFNNILKHSEATRAIFVLKTFDNQIFMTIKDNGKGLDSGAKKTGIGLKNIQSRAAFLNGKFEMKPMETGSEFEFSFPI